MGEAWIEIPAEERFALEGIVPNPPSGPWELAPSLPIALPARIEICDIAGRRMLARDVGSLGTGIHRLRLEEPAIGGEDRSNLAAIDVTTGRPTAWNPRANDAVWSLAKSGSTIYAGGYFTMRTGTCVPTTGQA